MTHPAPRLPIPLSRVSLLAAAALAWCAAAPPARAQEAEPVCAEGRISSLFIDNHSVFDLSDPDLNPRFGWAYRAANRLHRATRSEVIRRELLFREGDCYDLERLRDSERLLRGLSFIADVDIFGVRQADGSVHVIVDTQDEWSLRVDARVGSGGNAGLSGLRLREDNLLGTGKRLAAFYVQRREEQVYGAGFTSPQLFGSRWDGTVDVGKTPVGMLVNQAVTYPFVGEEGRWAFRQAAHHNDRYFEFLMPQDGELTRIWLPERRVSFELGGAVRFGRERFRRTLVGGSLVGEWVSYPKPARYADDPDRAPVLPGSAMDSVASVRAMLLLGQRNVYYVRRKGLDTVNGTEDLRLGVETQVVLGPSLPGLTEGRDLALDFGLFTGGEVAGVGIAGAQFMVEARRDYRSPLGASEWSDVLAQLNAWTYLRARPDARHVLVGSLSAAGGWHNRVPFQLTLGGEAGVRGYRDHLEPGGRRVVATLEQRNYLWWPLPELFDLGTVAFLDVGRIWAGDAPFGVDSPVRADAGVGLRAAFPPGSRQTLRVDLGVPLRPGVRLGDVVLSVGVGQVVGSRASRRDPQLDRSRRLGSPSSAFVFPVY